jgi:hypothetical protein
MIPRKVGIIRLTRVKRKRSIGPPGSKRAAGGP